MTRVIEIEESMFEIKPPAGNEAGSMQRDFSKVSVPKLIRVKLAGRAQPDFPHEILLGSLRSGDLRVRKPIPVSLRLEDGRFVAEAAKLDEFGFGQTASQSISDLQRAISELYLTLEESAGSLGTDLSRVWKALQRHVEKRSAISNPGNSTA